MALDLPENVVVSKLDELASWCRKNSLWPMPFATGGLVFRSHHRLQRIPIANVQPPCPFPKGEPGAHAQTDTIRAAESLFSDKDPR